jgi:lysophospholipase L1-like esterase
MNPAALIRSLAVLAGAFAFVAASAHAQPTADATCGPTLPVPAAITRLEDALITPGTLDRAAITASVAQDAEATVYMQAQRARAAQDWASLCRYRANNASLLATGVAPDMVFLGDSITEFWAKADPAMFSTGAWVGRGISGQTSAQMLLRFQADVVALHPRHVHILAGTNDVAGNQGPVNLQAFRDNITAMVALARAQGIQVILGSIPPAKRMFWKPTLVPEPRIAEFNDWLKDFARQQKLDLVDYHAALLNAAGDDVAPELANDGVHPNRNGYAVMKRQLLQVLPQRP